MHGISKFSISEIEVKSILDIKINFCKEKTAFLLRGKNRFITISNGQGKKTFNPFAKFLSYPTESSKAT